MSTSCNLLGKYEMQNTSSNHINSSEPFPTSMPVGTAVVPSKRADDDDDIQFISSKPVKRRKIDEQEHKNEVQPPFASPTPVATFPNPILAHIPAPTPFQPPIVFSAQVPPHAINDPREGAQISDRRLSTGMVGLPSDFHTIELSYGLRGVSLPVLENFVLNQPRRDPRTPSPPELSPKQLPQTITPAMLDMPIRNGSTAYGVQGIVNREVAIPKTGGNTVEQTTPNREQGSIEPSPNQIRVLNTPITNLTSPPSTPPAAPRKPAAKISSMPPPPAPRFEQSQASSSNSTQKCPSTSEHSTKNSFHHGNSKQPCQICTRMRQQAQFARVQGVPMMPPNIPHHQLMSPVPCHQAYGQNLPPHMMGMPPSGMHPFAPGFPMMMPMQGNNFPNMSASHHMVSQQTPTPQAAIHQPPNTQSRQQFTGKPESPVATQVIPAPIPAPKTTTQQETTKSPQNAAPATTASTPTTTTSATTTTSPVKPPASLIQPTYRKPSPNLIVDVVETCQERFPFAEVAKRHNVPVDKVFDVFAAIIQVPLLRCPTDRRRAGKLATSRIKEYARAKRDILESSRGGRAGAGTGKNGDRIGTPPASTVITPLDVAQHMGTVDFPEGFHPGNNG